MLLQELLKSTYEYSAIKWNDAMKQYESDFESGSDEIKVMFTKTSTSGNHIVWSLSFKRTSEEDTNKYRYKEAFGINGKGDAFKILATVTDIIPKMIKAADEPQFFEFTADEDSRKKLYTTLARKFSNPNYKRITSGNVFDDLEEEQLENQEIFLFQHI